MNAGKANSNLKRITFAIDAMGGDNAPQAIIAGTDLFLQHNSNIDFMFFGDEEKILPILENFPKLKSHAKITHTKDCISSAEKPSIALRKGKKSSMKLAIDAVKDGAADAIISAGNTGALMIMSKLSLRSLDGVDRPAICTTMPSESENGSVVFLDMGANASCDAHNLAIFAVMGNAFAKVVLACKNPTIGLLNIGSEELKGNDTIKAANQIINEEYPNLNYKGYIEGDDILKGTVDIVVTDGFTGNITLKTIEGTSKTIKKFLKAGFNNSLLAKIGFLLSSFSLKKTFNKIDPRNHNGAMFLGLNGICIKSHGNADKVSFANALKVTLKLVKNQVNQQIIAQLKNN
jgi:glycerol-3-phosphate acyltransferase PlsX